MKRTAIYSFAILLAIAITVGPAAAQRLPDSVFDHGSQAFGNTLQDVPPDILSVELSPVNPVSDQPVWVRAIIKVDPDMSYFRVSKALMYYSTDGQDYTTVEMELVDEPKGLWQAQVPGFKTGDEVSIAVAGWDELGNAVFQIPVQKSVSRDALFKVITDIKDSDIPKGLDILDMSYGSNGETFYYCQTLAGPFQSFTVLGVSANAMSINNNDLRLNTHLSHNENDGPYLAYAPQFELATIVDMQDILKERKIDNAPGVSITAKGGKLCARAPVSTIIKDPKHGVKVFSATVSINPGTENIMLVDATPYAILYVGGTSYTVK